MGRIRVLMVSKALIRGIYQKKLEELAKFPDLALKVIVPPGWREAGQFIPLEQAPAVGYQLVVEKMALNGHFHLHFYPGLGRRIRQFRPHILHMDEEPYNLATFQGFWLGPRAGAKCLFFTWQNLQRSYPFPFSAMQRHSFRHASFALAGSHEAAAVLRAKGYRGPLEMIPQFGVDPELFRPLEGLPRDRETHPFTIGYVGRLIEAKGVQVLLWAMTFLSGHDWELKIVGSGPHRGHLERLAAKLGLRERVVFQEPIPSSQLPAILSKLDVLILPSLTRPRWKEQFGRVLVEAMACGIPVIGSDSGEIPNVVGEAGLVFPEGDVQALSRRLEQLREDQRLWETLSRRGRERVLAHYTQAQIAQRTYAVYCQMMAGP